MKVLRAYRDKTLVLQLSAQLHDLVDASWTFMEVCGGHTMAFYKFGLPALLPDTIHLLSGPGCPVCVTDTRYIDQAVAYSRLPDVALTTFGDLLRVPGSTSSLTLEKARGADIRTVYSSLEALAIARETPHKRVIFLGIGFETTAPTSAAAVLEAEARQLPNFFLFSAHKVMPPAMAALVKHGIPIHGYLCPGHVSVIAGTAMYEPLVADYGLSCVVSGFEPVDMLQSLVMLVTQRIEQRPAVAIQYSRAVTPAGNPKALNLMRQVFRPRDDWWRGLGVLPDSGLGLADAYQHYDAERMIAVEVEETREVSGCICGDILQGARTPAECPLFADACTPASPVGACMVSNEGACAAYYRYNQ